MRLSIDSMNCDRIIFICLHENQLFDMMTSTEYINSLLTVEVSIEAQKQLVHK